MAKDFVDQKARTGIHGIRGLSKVVNDTAWGEAKALERYGKDYGGAPKTFGPPPDRSMPHFKDTDGRGKDWADYELKNSWLRGCAPAENKPGYDRTQGSVYGKGKK